MELTLNQSTLCAPTRRAGLTLLFLFGLGPPGPIAAQSAPSSRDRVVLVAFYSRTGNTEAMANAVAEGARDVSGVRVELKPISAVSATELEGIAGLLVGSPTHWGNIPPEVATFIAEWPFLGETVAGAFATAGNPGGGSENVLQSLISAFLNHGAMVVGPVFGEPGGRRWGWMGAAALTGPVGPGVNEVELDGARRLGRRVAEAVLGR